MPSTFDCDTKKGYRAVPFLYLWSMNLVHTLHEALPLPRKYMRKAVVYNMGGQRYTTTIEDGLRQPTTHPAYKVAKHTHDQLYAQWLRKHSTWTAHSTSSMRNAERAKQLSSDYQKYAESYRNILSHVGKVVKQTKSPRSEAEYLQLRLKSSDVITARIAMHSAMNPRSVSTIMIQFVGDRKVRVKVRDKEQIFGVSDAKRVLSFLQGVLSV